MNSLPASYMKYYYFEREMLAELQAKPTTRAEDISADVPSYWQHYREQLDAANPMLEPAPLARRHLRAGGGGGRDGRRVQ